MAPKQTEEIEITDRDFVMARVAAGMTSAQAAIDAMHEFIALCVNPEDDKRGKTRRDALELALESLGVAVHALECAEENAPEMDFSEGEPWEGEEDDEEEDEDEDEDEDD